jgi:hypothetical protein
MHAQKLPKGFSNALCTDLGFPIGVSLSRLTLSWLDAPFAKDLVLNLPHSCLAGSGVVVKSKEMKHPVNDEQLKFLR